MRFGPRAIAWPAIGFALAFAAAGCGSGSQTGTFCGNGRLDPGEACDDGRQNSDERAGACRTNCAVASCGDAVVDPGEGCDDGADNSDRLPGACRDNCVPAYCGDGVKDPGEGCDDGEANGPGARCSNYCVPGSCGDGNVDEGEECDNGAWNDDETIDACRTTCLLAHCGDGVVDTGEGCDEGVENHDTRPGACRTSCMPAACGDGVVDPGEECDDGKGNDDRYPGFCRTSCRLPHCGDGVVDIGEQCDEGKNNSDVAQDACRTDCAAPACGDGVKDTGEECDEGDANDDLTAHGCRTSCRLPHCGDGVKRLGEECDDGELNNDDTPGACRTSCRTAHCGDGVRDEGEGCDEGARNSDEVSGACRSNCQLPRCGDGVVDEGEACDDGAPGGDDACGATCELTLPATCFDPSRPVLDLRSVGSPDVGGFVVNGLLPAGPGLVGMNGCYAPATEVFYAFPVTMRGDLVVEVEPAPGAGGFRPAIGVRRGCGGDQVACIGPPVDPEVAILTIPDVSPAEGAYIIQVDGMAEAVGREFTLRAHIRPPLAHGDPCTTTGTLGRCPEGSHICSATGDDEVGLCLPLLDPGSACGPEIGVCREPQACREGICAISCGDGIKQPWETCDDGNAKEDDGCTSMCVRSAYTCAVPFDLTALWDDGARRVTWSGTTVGLTDEIAGPCNSRTAPDAVASFVAPRTGRYSFVHDGPGSQDVLSILETCGSNSQVLGCAAARTSYSLGEAATLELSAGQHVYLIADSTSVYAREFEVRVDMPVCGDGVVQGAEECDDGNTVGGDACRPDCALPGYSCLDWYPLQLGSDPTATWTTQLRRPDFSDDFTPSCAAQNRADAVARFTAPTAGRYSFVARSSNTSSTLTVAVYDRCSQAVELACGTRGNTSELPAIAEAVLAAGQTVHVAVDTDITKEFTLTAGRVVCGDGHRVLPEACDDGNLLSGDGCDSTCHVETVAEVEPNDVRAVAQPLAVGKTLRGSLGLGDVDYVALSLAAGVSYEFETFIGGWELCDPEIGAYRTVLLLHGPDGNFLVSDIASGILNCSKLAFTATESGVHYLRVQEYVYSGPYEGIPSYLLRTATVTP